MEETRHDFRKGTGSNLRVTESCLLLPLVSRRAALLNHHGYMPAVRGVASSVQGDVSNTVKDVWVGGRKWNVPFPVLGWMQDLISWYSLIWSCINFLNWFFWFYWFRALGEDCYLFVAKYSPSWGKLSVASVSTSENLWWYRGWFHMSSKGLLPKATVNSCLLKVCWWHLFTFKMKNSFEKHWIVWASVFGLSIWRLQYYYCYHYSLL